MTLQMRRFLVVGIVSTFVDYLFYSLLIYFQLLPTTYAIAIGYLFGFLLSFFLTRSYVFSEIKVDKIHREFIIVFVIAFVGLLLNILIVKALAYVGTDLYSARVVAIGIVFFFNYYVRKVFVYG
ncbi:MAG: GtrA family protein [Epsilonproteobacteria bacterium]|nr:GtrA family protein [Campylobacterota bacterium]